jgi:hypothetical protein
VLDCKFSLTDAELIRTLSLIGASALLIDLDWGKPLTRNEAAASWAAERARNFSVTIRPAFSGGVCPPEANRIMRSAQRTAHRQRRGSRVDPTSPQVEYRRVNLTCEVTLRMRKKRTQRGGKRWVLGLPPRDSARIAHLLDRAFSPRVKILSLDRLIYAFGRQTRLKLMITIIQTPRSPGAYVW